MKKVITITASFLLFGLFAQAQTPTVKAKDWSKLNLTNRAADHLVIQYGSDFLTGNGKPDSVNTGNGFSRHFNIYFMYDRPFIKSNPKYSVAFGGGIGTSNIFFDDHTLVDVKSTANSLPFRKLDSLSSYFSKNKLTTLYIQVPVELRYYTNPENPSKSMKYAAGLKIGSLLKSYTKSKNYVNGAGNSVYGKSYIEKRSANRFISGTSIEVTGRVGYGMVSLDCGYMISGVLRDGFGPVINKFSAGITISGL
jgi:hypothetical protein